MKRIRSSRVFGSEYEHLQYLNSFNTPSIGVAVDASCVGGNPATVECRGINLATKEFVFDEKVGIATNNIGEWLAIAYGAEYICYNNLNIPLYSDSKICINWYHKQICRTNIFRDYPHLAAQNKELVRLLDEAMEIVTSCRVDIKFWNKHLYGENVADYGRK
jgi:ribonuclease HI